MKNTRAKGPGKGRFCGKAEEIPGKPIRRTCPELRRVPQVPVSRPVFHLVRWMAIKSPSARIFLQHLQPRKR